MPELQGGGLEHVVESHPPPVDPGDDGVPPSPGSATDVLGVDPVRVVAGRVELAVAVGLLAGSHLGHGYSGAHGSIRSGAPPLARTGRPDPFFPWSTPRRSRGCWTASQVLGAAALEREGIVSCESDRIQRQTLQQPKRPRTRSGYALSQRRTARLWSEPAFFAARSRSCRSSFITCGHDDL